MIKLNLLIPHSFLLCRPSQLKTEFLALLSVTFVSENNIVAAVRFLRASFIRCNILSVMVNL